MMRTLLGFFLIFLLLTSTTNAQCPSLFNDGFESGNYTPNWAVGTGTYTRSVTTSNPASGNYCFEQTGAGSHYSGVNATIPSGQPPYMSIWVKTSNLSNHSSYVVIGDANTTTNNGILFFYFYASTGMGRLYANGSNEVQFPASANTWYQLEFRNINWISKTFDYYVNGNLLASNFPFRSTTSTAVEKVYLYSLSGTGTSHYDGVNIGGLGLDLSSFSTDVACAGDTNGSANVTANNGTSPYTYTWSNGGSSSSISGLTPGTYSVVVVDSIGCTDSISATVSSPPALASTMVAQGNICPNGNSGTIDLTASGGVGGYSYLWNNGSTSEDPSGLGAGTYSVVITDSNGCTLTDSATIGAPAAIQPNAAVSNISCNGANDGAIDLSTSGGTPGYSYQWSNSATTEDLSGLAGGSYSVAITDSLGCVQVDSFTIVDPQPISLVLQGVDILCAGADNGEVTTSLTGGTPGYTYLWNNGSTAPSLSNLGPGNYSVVVTDTNGCTATDSATVGEPAALSGSGTTTGDNGTSNGAIDITVAGGTPTYTYAWSGPGGFSATSEDITGLVAGTYTVTVTDGNGCTWVETFVVNTEVGIQNGTDGPMVTIAPNPTGGAVNVTISQAASQPMDLRVIDLQGRVVFEQHIEAGLQMAERIDLSQLPNGVYMLHVANGTAQTLVRVVKQ